MKFHPHGDQSVYEVLVRMAQYFQMYPIYTYPNGNFGNEFNSSAAAMR